MMDTNLDKFGLLVQKKSTEFLVQALKYRCKTKATMTKIELLSFIKHYFKKAKIKILYCISMLCKFFISQIWFCSLANQ